MPPVACSRLTASTSLFIHPGHRFRVVQGLVTNFHLPQSSLLMLVAAFTGRERILAAYREAVEHRYRFYSYGDAHADRLSPPVARNRGCLVTPRAGSGSAGKFSWASTETAPA